MKTVKVRIAVAVDPEGEVSAAALSPGKPWNDADYILDHLAPGEARYIFTAELPVPEAQEIAATVEEVK